MGSALRSGLLLIVAGLSGCGAAGIQAPAVLAPVSGKVQLDGQPLAGATVYFAPRDQTGGQGAYAVTDADGAYELVHRSGQKGIEPGTYTVKFSKVAMPDGSPIPAGKDAADVEAGEVLPKHLTDPSPDTVSGVVTVPKEGGKFDFLDLKSKFGR